MYSPLKMTVVIISANVCSHHNMDGITLKHDKSHKYGDVLEFKKTASPLETSFFFKIRLYISEWKWLASAVLGLIFL
jgi:hypothetical protein